MTFIIVLVGFVNAAQIWTTDINGNIKSDFSPEEIVYIHGNGFGSNQFVFIDIIRPDTKINSGLLISNSVGYFVYEYQLDGITGLYTIYASDGINNAQITFEDSAIWTTKNDCGDLSQDVNQYNIGDHVYINGDGFSAGNYNWEIKGKPGGASCDPNIVVASGTRIVGSSGSFCFDAYTILSGDCGEYQVKLDTKGDNYRVDTNICGDGDIDVGEQCEPPNHQNDNDCDQSTTDCLNHKKGIRDNRGDCDSTCGCVEDPFVYSCVQGACGATCDGNSDCNDYNPNTQDICANDCICQHVPIQYCGDNIIQQGEQCELPSTNNNNYCSQTTENGCQGNKLGTRDLFGNCNSLCGCINDQFNYQCVVGNCNAECIEGQEESEQCGTDVGECEFGTQKRICAGNCIWNNWGECTGDINPVTEICDGKDNDCDGLIDEGFDADADGVADCFDKCPNSKPNEPVDVNGCDPFQFCEPFYCGLSCFYADFMNNEPFVKYPHDCTVVIIDQEGKLVPKCVPTVVDSKCFG